MPKSAPSTLHDTPADLAPHEELERQVANLVARGYPASAGLSEAAFRDRVAPLANRVGSEPAGDGVPFVLVVPDVVPPEVAITQVVLREKAGITTMEADDLARFRPLDRIERPPWPYLLVDVSTGPDTLDLPPADAMPKLLAAGRSPLTIDEGIALVTHHPQVLRERNCFSTLGSRCGDRRVPAIWLSRGRPRLGWCWEGAPHTWLGSASAGSRLPL